MILTLKLKFHADGTKVSSDENLVSCRETLVSTADTLVSRREAIDQPVFGKISVMNRG